MILGTFGVSLWKICLYCRMVNIYGIKFKIVKDVVLKKTVKKCFWGHPTQEAFESGEWAIMGCCMERVRSRWACTKCEWKYYHPQDIPENMYIGAEDI